MIPDAPRWIKKEEYEYRLTFWDGEGWYRAEVKWDGCVHFWRYHNAPGEDEDYLHICDLDDLILRLQQLRATVREAWPWWPDWWSHDS